MIVDGCDGEVARLKMQESRFGYLFDVVTDNIVHVAIFVAIGVGQYRAAPSESHVLLAVLLLSGLALSLVASYVCLIRHPPVQRLAPRSRKGKLRKRLLLAFEAVMNRDFAYVLLTARPPRPPQLVPLGRRLRQPRLHPRPVLRLSLAGRGIEKAMSDEEDKSRLPARSQVAGDGIQEEEIRLDGSSLRPLPSASLPCLLPSVS